MLLKEQKVKIKSFTKNFEYFTNKGYVVEEGYFNVKVEDLQHYSHKKIKFKCDYCGEIHEKEYHSFLNGRKLIQKDACGKCKYKKQEEIMLLKYGVRSPMHVDEFKNKLSASLKSRTEEEKKAKLEKYKKTCLERYGVDNAFKSEKIKEKIKATCLDKYGEVHFNKTEEYKEKIKNYWENIDEESKNEIINKRRKTCLERYGVEWTHQNEKIKEKVKRTNLKRYGVEWTTQAEEVKEKIQKNWKKSRVENGNITTSKQQEYLASLLNLPLNILVDEMFILDMAFESERIYIEYNGGGHNLSVKLGKISEEEFRNKELKRYFALKDRGWKGIFIESKKDLLPSDEKIIEMVNIAKNNINKENTYRVLIDIDKETIEIKDKIFDFDFGNLRKI